MPAHVYILLSVPRGAFYVGSSSDLPRRLADSQRRHSPYTRSRGPWELVYREEFADLSGARRREQQIKVRKSHRAIEELIRAAQSGERVPACQRFESAGAYRSNDLRPTERYLDRYRFMLNGPPVLPLIAICLRCVKSSECASTRIFCGDGCSSDLRIQLRNPGYTFYSHRPCVLPSHPLA